MAAVRGFVFGIGWLVGLVRLRDSRAWTIGEKLLGTLIIPFGLAGSLFFAQILAGGTSQTDPCPTPQQRHGCVGMFTVSHNPGVLDYAGAVLILIAPIVVAIYLTRSRRDRLTAAPAAA